MVNDLTELMRENVASPPPDHLDLDAVVRAGRRRVRGRRFGVVGVAAALVAGVVAVTSLAWPHGSGQVGPASHPPAPDAPTLRLADAARAVEGRDYKVLASYTNKDLDGDNGQYFDGVTDDGKILFRDGPRSGQLYPRFALMDPATGEKDWLPDPGLGQGQTWPVRLSADRLVMLGIGDGPKGRLVAHVFDRATRRWSSVEWPGLPAVNYLSAVMGPEDRLYALVPATQGTPPVGGWPTGPGGEAEDADAQGDTYHLWSVSLTDTSHVRDEGLTVGSLAFTGTSMVWTDSTNGEAGLVHVRDLATGKEHSFDPHTGERCNLLSFGATDDRVVLSQYCGTYADGVRDDRVQILTTNGEQVATLQDSGIDGSISGSGNTGNLVTVTAYLKKQAGTYVYDLETNRFLRLSDAISHWALGGLTPGGELLWSTPVNNGHGATQWLGRLVR